MVTYKGVNHLVFATHDMDLTIRFWRDLLGLRLVAGIGDQNYRHYFFELTGSDMIAFFEWPDVEACPEKDHGVPVKGPFCFDHVSLGVAADEDLWELMARLDAAGFWVSEVMDHGFIHSLYSFDPNQIPIEFSAPVEGVDLGKNPVMKDRCPTKTALEGPEPQTGIWPEPSGPIAASERLIFPGEGLVLSELGKTE
ncbi:MAG TPA: VOC family protein [Desulfosalsimonadaceae bacterium]|nr:VOC family protein [Desulfosalsimonadaceae bacterium]